MSQHLPLLSVSKLPVYSIPVRPHVRKYLSLWFGTQQPHALHQNTFLGRLVRMKVEKQPFRQLSRPIKPEGSVYDITLPVALKHSILTPEAARQLGETLDKLFQEKMITFVMGYVVATQNERAGLRAFCKCYDIDPSEADLEMLRKLYRDYKDKVLRENGQHNLIYGADRELLNMYAAA
jgi:hypothetical protein